MLLRRIVPVAVVALLAAGAAATLGLFAPASSSAAIVGIGDQKPNFFTEPLFRDLGVRRSRLIIPWNTALRSEDRRTAKAWLDAAQRARVEPLVAFNHARSDRCPASPCRLPSVKSYIRAVKAFRKQFPRVKLFQPWNETNSPTQPTGKNPRRAAEYYNAFVRQCRGCTVVAADIQDLSERTMRRWIGTFRRFVRGNPRLWGLHNYSDTNRGTSAKTKLMLRLVPGDIWLTETGGIFSFTTQSGDQPLGGPSEARAARSMRSMYKLARLSRRIKRLYIYQWQKTAPSDRFDAGIVNEDGTPRDSYDVVRKNKRLFK